MEPTTLVTGAGGPAGVAVIRALRWRGVRVIAVDSDPLAVGLRLADEGATVPPSDDPTFLEELCRVARRWSVGALVCTVSEELVRLIPARHHLAEAGVSTWLPGEAAVRTCMDKWRFAGVMRSAGIPAPPSSLGEADGVPGPWVVKPRFGRGSRDVFPADRAEDLPWLLARVPDPIVQTRLAGREFTVDALRAPDGSLAGAVPRWRLETKAGISTKGRTFADPALLACVGDVLAAVGLVGPANVQGFVDEDDRATFVEVNPRFSGGLPLSLAAGADLVGEYLRCVRGLPIRPERLRYRPGVTMIRHFEEVFEG